MTPQEGTVADLGHANGLHGTVQGHATLEPPEPLLVIVTPMPVGGMFLNSNNRIHRMQVAKLTKMWREAGKRAAAGLPPIEGTVRIVATIHKNRDGRWDPNNLWPTIKALVDGVVDAGVLADDDWTHVVGPDMRRGVEGEPRVVLEFEPAGCNCTEVLDRYCYASRAKSAKLGA